MDEKVNIFKPILKELEPWPEDDEFDLEQIELMNQMIRWMNKTSEAHFNFKEGNITKNELNAILKEDDVLLQDWEKRIKEFKKKWGD